MRTLILLAVLSTPDDLHAVEAAQQAPVPVRVTDDFMTVAERFGVPTAFCLLFWLLFATQQRRRERRDDDESARRQARDDRAAAAHQEREKAFTDHLLSMDERRAGQLEKWANIQEQQVKAMDASSSAQAKQSETMDKLAGLTQKLVENGERVA